MEEGTSTQLASIALSGITVDLCRATVDDLPHIIALLSDDPLGREREAARQEDMRSYRTAFEAIDADEAHLLVVVKNGSDVVGTMQLTFIPGLSRRGALRAQIEGVRVHDDYRSLGLGSRLFEWAIDQARARGCTLVQLTTDRSRSDAHRFYQQLGFVSSHEGFKLAL